MFRHPGDPHREASNEVWLIGDIFKTNNCRQSTTRVLNGLSNKTHEAECTYIASRAPGLKAASPAISWFLSPVENLNLPFDLATTSRHF